MTDVPYIFLLISIVVVVIITAPSDHKAKLTPLLSFIEGRVYLKFRLPIVTVLEGTWQGVKVKVELKYDNYSSIMFVTLFSSHQWPFSLKVRPASGSLGRTFLPVSSLMDGDRFEIPEAEIAVYSHAGDETMIRQLLNNDRLAVIREMFSNEFNYLEINADPIAGSYLKAGLEGCRQLHLSDFGFIEEYENAIRPEAVRCLLEQLREFSNADTDITGVKHELSGCQAGSEK